MSKNESLRLRFVITSLGWGWNVWVQENPLPHGGHKVKWWVREGYCSWATIGVICRQFYCSREDILGSKGKMKTYLYLRLLCIWTDRRTTWWIYYDGTLEHYLNSITEHWGGSKRAFRAIYRSFHYSTTICDDGDNNKVDNNNNILVVKCEWQ